MAHLAAIHLASMYEITAGGSSRIWRSAGKEKPRQKWLGTLSNTNNNNRRSGARQELDCPGYSPDAARSDREHSGSRTVLVQPGEEKKTTTTSGNCRDVENSPRVRASAYHTQHQVF